MLYWPHGVKFLLFRILLSAHQIADYEVLINLGCFMGVFLMHFLLSDAWDGVKITLFSITEQREEGIMVYHLITQLGNCH